MSDSIFIDTNVLLYTISSDPRKKKTAMDLCGRGGVVSLNVLNEYANVCRKKFGIKPTTIKTDVDHLLRKLTLIIPTIATLRHALDIGESTGYSHFDSLMLATALEAECTVFYSEDLQHSQVIEGKLTVIDPFRLDAESSSS